MIIDIEVSDNVYNRLQRGEPVNITLQSRQILFGKECRTEDAAQKSENRIPMCTHKKGEDRILMCTHKKVGHHLIWGVDDLYEAKKYSDNSWDFDVPGLKNRHSLDEINEDMPVPYFTDVTEIVLELKAEKIDQERDRLRDYLQTLVDKGEIFPEEKDDELKSFEAWCNKSFLPSTKPYRCMDECFYINPDPELIKERLESSKEGPSLE